MPELASIEPEGPEATGRVPTGPQARPVSMPVVSLDMAGDGGCRLKIGMLQLRWFEALRPQWRDHPCEYREKERDLAFGGVT